MANFFGSIARKSQIDSLTSSKDEASAVYALQELADLVKNADEKTVSQIASYMCTGRLSNKSAVVKRKTLRAIKYIASKPECLSFRSAVQQHSSSLRDCVNFTCPADPLKGNKPAESVREAAKEAIHTIFSTDSGNVSQQNSMQGFGSTTSANDPQRQSAQAKASSMFSLKSEVTRRLSWSRSGDNGQQNPQVAGSPRGMYNRQEGFNQEPSKNTSAPVPVPIAYNSSRNEPSSSEASMGRIQQLLEKVCQRKGVKLQPPADQVRVFVSAAQDVHVEDLWAALKGKLSANGSWQQQYITLCLLQAVMDCHNDGYRKAVCDFVAGDVSCIQHLGNVQHATLSHKARSVLSKLSGSVGGQGHGHTTSQSAVASSAQPTATAAAVSSHQGQMQADLLDLGLGGAAPVPNVSQPQEVDLLGGLQIGGGGGGAASTTTANTATAAAPVPRTSTGGSAVPAGDLFARVPEPDG